MSQISRVGTKRREPIPEFEHNFDRETPAHARLYAAPNISSERPRLRERVRMASPESSARRQVSKTRVDDSKLESRVVYPPTATQILEPKTNSDLFYAHGTESARTLRPLQISYARVAGTDAIEGTFILNSINVGVTDYLQVGTNPIIYAVPNSYNFSAKVNFYSSEKLAFALGYNHLTVTNLLNWGLDMHHNGLSVISNYFLDERWSFSHLVQATHHYSAIGGADYERFSQVSQFIDAQYRINSNWISTSGMSYSPGPVQRNASLARAEKMTLGIGSSMTWKIPRSWFFMYPALGLH